jgi:DNA-directed RNA polymerase specialized sigma24 family protein
MGSTEGTWAAEELIDQCLRRPTEAAAWQEFVRRFHPTIQSSVANVFACLTTNPGSVKQGSFEEIIHDLVQEVYRRLTENDGAALRSMRSTGPGSMKNHLLLISINAVRDHFRAATRDLRDHRGKANPGTAVDLHYRPSHQQLRSTS